MRYLLYITTLILFVNCEANHQQQLENIDVSELLVQPKQYVVAKTTTALTIDGNADEAAWSNAPFTDAFIDIEGEKMPKFNTKAKLLWDDTFLYIYAELEEPHIWANLKQRDTIIFYNNDFEVFIDPSHTTKNYGEIEINALNTVWDLHLDKPYRVGGKPNNHWDIKGLKSAIQIHGTLNDARDVDSLWTVEMAIPLKSIAALKGSGDIPKDGEQWRINFSRVEWDFDLIDGKYYRKKVDGTFLPEYNWVWSNQKVINMHEPEKWGYIQFSDVEDVDAVSFKRDDNETLKQTAYALFRLVSYGSLKELKNEEAGFSKDYTVTIDKNTSVHATFYKTNMGFEWKITGDTLYFINEEGILKAN